MNRIAQMEHFLSPMWQKKGLTCLILLTLGFYLFQLSHGNGVFYLMITPDVQYRLAGFISLSLALLFFFLGMLFFFLLDLHFKVNRLYILLLLLIGMDGLLQHTVSSFFLLGVSFLQLPLFCYTALDLFTTLSGLAELPAAKRLRRVMLGLLLATMVLLLLDFYQYEFMYIILVYFYFSLLYLFFKYRNRQRNRLKKQQQNCLLAFFLIYVPQISLFQFEVSPILQSSCGFLNFIFPCVFGFYLLKGNHRQLLMHVQAGIGTAGGFLLCLLGFFWFGITQGQLSYIQCLLTLALVGGSFFCCRLLYGWLLTQPFEKKRQKDRQLSMELVERATLQQHLWLLSQTLLQMLQEKIPHKSALLLWKEGEKEKIIFQSGHFAGLSLKQLPPLSEEIVEIRLFQQPALCLPLKVQTEMKGWLLLDTPVFLGKNQGEVPALLAKMAENLATILTIGEVIQGGDFLFHEKSQARFDEKRSQRFVFKLLETTRKELAYYLHDEVLQTILALRKLAQQASQETALATLQRIAEELAGLNLVIRGEMFQLYPRMLNDLPFEESLWTLVESLQQKNPEKNFPIIEIETEIKLIPQEMRFVLYRMLGELLQNAVKHSQCQKIRIEITDEGEKIQALVTDDGVGFDWQQVLNEASAGFGLYSVAVEAKSLNGTLMNLSQPSFGTKLCISLPKTTEGWG